MGMGEDTYSASISTVPGDREGANQEAGMVTNGTHMHIELGGPCSAGSELITG